MVEDNIKVFMDDFSVVGDSFIRFLIHLVEVPKSCECCKSCAKLGKMSHCCEKRYINGPSHLEKGNRG